MPGYAKTADPASEPRQVAIDKLRLEDACQARADRNPDVIEEYAEQIRNGVDLGALETFKVDSKLVLVDGYHRLAGHGQAGNAFVPVVVVGEGTLQDASWYAVSVNQAHGLRRSNADKRRAVRMALGIGPERSSRAIAEHVGVSNDFVSRVRREVSLNDTCPEVVVGADGKRYPVKSKDPGLGPGRQRRGASDDADAPISHRPDYEPDEWYTPAAIVDMAREVLGEIDLDPASSEMAQRTVRAAQWHGKDEDGLTFEWRGRIWCNPPYSHPLGTAFVNKLADEIEAGHVEAAIFLQNASVDTTWFHRLAPLCSKLCFPSKRISFVTPAGIESRNGRYASVLFYFGPSPELFSEVFGRVGLIMTPDRPGLAPTVKSTADPSRDVAGAVKALRRQIRDRFGEHHPVDHHLEAAWRAVDDDIGVDCPFCDLGGCADCDRGRTTKGEVRRAKEKARSRTIAREAVL